MKDECITHGSGHVITSQHVRVRRECLCKQAQHTRTKKPVHKKKKGGKFQDFAQIKINTNRFKKKSNININLIFSRAALRHIAKQRTHKIDLSLIKPANA